LWGAPEVEISPALQYLVPHQSVELSPADASLRGIANGEEVVVAQNGTRLAATAVIRSSIPDGAAFLADGIADGSANALTGRLIEVVKVGS
jgi:anaerobic selenocysteine-containing dehydrogenase